MDVEKVVKQLKKKNVLEISMSVTNQEKDFLIKLLTVAKEEDKQQIISSIFRAGIQKFIEGFSKFVLKTKGEELMN